MGNHVQVPSSSTQIDDINENPTSQFNESGHKSVTPCVAYDLCSVQCRPVFASNLLRFQNHGPPKPHDCSVCKQLNLIASDMSPAVGNLMDEGRHSLSCKICNNRFMHSSCLFLHMWTHITVKRFCCNRCMKLCRSRAELLKHQRAFKEQNQNKPLSGLVKHYEMRCKRFSCERSSFPERQNKEKPYQCNACNKSWSTETDVLFHMRMHVEETTESLTESKDPDLIKSGDNGSCQDELCCSKCNISFLDKKDLLDHVKHHVDIKP